MTFQVDLVVDNKFLVVAKEYKMTFQVGLVVDNKFLVRCMVLRSSKRV